MSALPGEPPSPPRECLSPTLRRASARIHQEPPAPHLSLAIRLDLQGWGRGTSFCPAGGGWWLPRCPRGRETQQPTAAL